MGTYGSWADDKLHTVARVGAGKRAPYTLRVSHSRRLELSQTALQTWASRGTWAQGAAATAPWRGVWFALAPNPMTTPFKQMYTDAYMKAVSRLAKEKVRRKRLIRLRKCDSQNAPNAWTA